MAEPQVLVVGAGPTGLVLALSLARLGVRVRIIDRVAEPGATSRALVVHARTLEFYAQLGMAEGVVERGLRFDAVNLWVRAKRAARVHLGAIGEGISPFPYLIVFPQDEHERYLITCLTAQGIEVERETEVLSFTDGGDGITAQLRHTDGRESSCAADYIAGCDGARSRVRDILGTGFPGGTYSHLFYVADVQGSGPGMDGELSVALDTEDFLAAFPMSKQGRGRLIGTAEAPGSGAPALGWEDVGKQLLERLHIHVERVNWFSTYRVHHRVASRFRQGRAFLLGDAAHIHSPVGGQGMNTGIGDAVNLAWKLAAVLQGRAAPPLLDTYEPERIAFARRLVATTDRAFTMVSSPGRLARILRTTVVPRLLATLFRVRAVRQQMFRMVSQTAIRYRRSPLSEGRAGPLHAGDRLPWLAFTNASGEPASNHTLLQSLDWQVHTFGPVPHGTAQACWDRGIALDRLVWSEDARRKGFRRGTLYLIRPDGYLGLVDRGASLERLEAYLDRNGIRPR